MDSSSLKDLARHIGHLIAALSISVVTAWGVGFLVWIIWNGVIFSHDTAMHISYYQSFGIAFLFDVLMTPSAVYGMQLMHSATTANERPAETQNPNAGTPQQESK